MKKETLEFYIKFDATYIDTMYSALNLTSGIMWIIQIPVTSITYFYHKIVQKVVKLKYPEEFI